MVAEILQKSANERTADNYEDVHKFMSRNIKFFQREKQAEIDSWKNQVVSSLTAEDKLKLYKTMLCKVYKRGEKLCSYDEQGDCFFIILEGMVGVRVPM